MKKCLLIAPLEAHATVGRLAALAATGLELHVIDVSANSLRFELSRYPFTKIASYVKFCPKSRSGGVIGNKFGEVVLRLRSLGMFPQSRHILKFLSKEIARIEPDVVVTYYGPIGISFARSVKSVNSSLPTVSVLNLIPSALDYKKGFLGVLFRYINNELRDYRRILKKLDFVVCASSGMAKYVAGRYGVDRDKTVVLPDYFPKVMSIQTPLLSLDTQSPRLVFLGAPERWGGALDDIDDQFLDIARSGIAIYSGKLSESVIATNYGACYPFFSDDDIFSGVFSTFAHTFDAALITYGVSTRHQRFATTLPTRFFSAISAGIPVAVRSGLFDAVESYVVEHSIGFVYQTTNELRLRLEDRIQMKKYRENAINHSKEANAENQAREFLRIFELVSPNVKGS